MTDNADLAALVEQLAGSRVLCVGDVMLDRFVYGQVERISPEAPIPVLRVERETAMLGGAGNVIRNLVSLGAQAVFVSVVGNDTAGHEVTGLVGAGGGFLIVPALVLLGGLPMRDAVGTSLLVIALNSLAGFAGYLSHVAIDIRLALSVTGAALAGAVAGAVVSHRVDPARLRRGFAGFVVAMAVWMLWLQAGELGLR